MNLVISVTFRCNSRCLTCNIWKKDQEELSNELSLEELERVFRNIGQTPYYLTFSGGEPFLRKDLAEVVAAGYTHCRPKVITIPTNGILWRTIPGQVERILAAAPGSQVIINLSLDGIGEEHDHIRGIKGNYELVLKTLEGLRAIKSPRLVLGLHTVVSRFNIENLPAIIDHAASLRPDSIITEVAERRVELGTVESEIDPGVKDYSDAADFLSNLARRSNARGFAKITQAFRARYYEIARKTLAEKRQIIPCYAGFASGHIAPNGDVWFCCMRAEPIGNLRDVDCDFARLWFSPRAVEMRKEVVNQTCHCPMANASYTNMLLDVPTAAQVGLSALLK